MKQIKYPPRGSKEFNAIIGKYKDLFVADLPNMERRWATWKANNGAASITETVEDLLVADTDVIADVYDRFVRLGIPSIHINALGKNERSAAYKELDGIFCYSHKYDTDIADFFNSNAEALHISSCYYCELAYINTYNVIHSQGRKSIHKRQFDIDHFLPKSVCPITALSLFNFVPSCQICNSRIKKSLILGDNKDERTKFNPASSTYSFDTDVKIRLRMWRLPCTAFRKMNDYYIYFRCRNGYDKPVEFFHLQDRYEFHKKEAIRLLKLKNNYPQSAIQRIAQLLGKATSEVREDLFHKKFLSDNNRCFSKLTRDILNT